MKFKIIKPNHISDYIKNINAIYIYDDVEDLYYVDNLDENTGNNTIPSDTIISKDDVQLILNKIKKCTTLFIEPRPKNTSFLSKYNLSVADCKQILDQLTINDYVKNTISKNSKHNGNNLIIFEPSTIILDNNKFNSLLIYIKVDIDETTDTSVVAVSIHETNFTDHKVY